MICLTFLATLHSPSVVGLNDEGEILYSTYLGGSLEDSVRAITIDNLGNVYVAGQTASTNFPILGGINNTYVGGSYDGFITKFSNNGDLLWSTYFGGSDIDVIRCIQVDSQGNIIISGYTQSLDFPLFNPLYTTINSYEIFITKISSAGDILWSTLIGGDGNDYPQSMVVDKSDNIIVVGNTLSTNYPTLNAFDTTYNGSEDVFITTFTPDGAMLWSTYLGGSLSDSAVGLALDSHNDIYITGSSYSTEFPLVNAFSRMQSGGEAFLIKLNTTGKIQWSTFFGGSSLDIGFDVTVDKYDNPVIIGSTQSTDLFLRNPYYSKNSGATDTFIARFMPDGLLSMSTYLGGSGTDTPYSIKVDGNNALIITGATGSPEFPVRDGYNRTLSSVPDDYLVIFSPQDELVMSTYLGGTGTDNGRGLDLDQNDDIWVTSYTTSSDFPTMSAYNATYGGGGFGDVALTKFNHTVSIQPISSTPMLANNVTVTLTETLPTSTLVSTVTPPPQTTTTTITSNPGKSGNSFVGISFLQTLSLTAIFFIPIIIVRKRNMF